MHLLVSDFIDLPEQVSMLVAESLVAAGKLVAYNMNSESS